MRIYRYGYRYIYRSRIKYNSEISQIYSVWCVNSASISQLVSSNVCTVLYDEIYHSIFSYGFVKYDSVEDARRALQFKDEIVINGKRANVSAAIRKGVREGSTSPQPTSLPTLRPLSIDIPPLPELPSTPTTPHTPLLKLSPPPLTSYQDESVSQPPKEIEIYRKKSTNKLGLSWDKLSLSWDWTWL